MAEGSTTTASTPSGLNHLVLKVRDIDVAHDFWTNIMGFSQCGDFPEMGMRFYNFAPDHHHDLALCQVTNPDEQPEPERWSLRATSTGIQHVAIAYPDRDAFLNQLQHLQANDIPFRLRGDHGMTHSVYITDPDGHGIEVLYEVPKELWKDDIEGALKYFKKLPKEGPEALEDNNDYPVFS